MTSAGRLFLRTTTLNGERFSEETLGTSALVKHHLNSIRQRLELPVRMAADDKLYTLEEYLAYYGEDFGSWKLQVIAQVSLRCSYVVTLADETRFLQEPDEPLVAIALEHADAKLKADKSTVMAAVSKHGNVLKYADWKLKADSEVVMAAVSRWPGALQYAHDEL